MAQRFALIVLGIIAVIQLTIATDIAGPSSVPSSKTGTGGPTFSRSRRVAGDLSGPSSAPSSKTGTSGPTFPRPHRAADNQPPIKPPPTIEVVSSVKVNNNVKVGASQNNAYKRTHRAATEVAKAPAPSKSQVQQPKKTANINEKYVPDLGSK